MAHAVRIFLALPPATVPLTPFLRSTMASSPFPSSAAPTAGAPVAIVSGANSGIGLAACVALASAGHIVYAGMRAGASADALLAAVAAAAGPATNADGTTDAGLSSPSVGAVHVLRMDVGADASVTAAVASVLAATADRVDVVVANAGYGAIANVEDASVADFEAILNVNFLGALRLVKAALPSMRRRRSGRVVGISSVVGLLGWPFYGPYSASKFAMEGLWESCFSEYKGLDVHFVLVRCGQGGCRGVGGLRGVLFFFFFFPFARTCSVLFLLTSLGTVSTCVVIRRRSVAGYRLPRPTRFPLSGGARPRPHRGRLPCVYWAVTADRH